MMFSLVTILLSTAIVAVAYLFRSSKLFYQYNKKLNELKISSNNTQVQFIDYLRSVSDKFFVIQHYNPTFWLNHFLLQTFYTGYAHRQGKKVDYKRELFSLEDGGEVGLDWYPKKPNSDTKKPIVVVLHMVASNSRERNCREMVLALTKDAQFDCVVFNFRGSGGVPLKTPKLYNAGLTSDLREILMSLDKQFKGSLKFAVGFSLGANLLTNYVGEFGNDTKLEGFVSIANPYSLLKSSTHVSNSWSGKWVLGPLLTSGLKTLFKKHKHAFKGTGIVENKWDKLHDFDTDVTAKIFGFKDATAYYTWAGCDKAIHKVVIPSLFISSLDDPIVPRSAIPYKLIQENENILLVTTETGGHVGWWTGNTNPKILYVGMVIDYLNALNNVCNNDIPEEFKL